MKKVMIIGSVHTDLVRYVKELPKGNEAAEIIKTDMCLGGSGYQAARLFSALGFPFQVISDPGESVYGEFARSQAEKYGIELNEGSGEIGGCTFTMIDEKGNTGIFCVDGSEYHFSLAQVYDIDIDEFGAVIVCSEMLAGGDCEEIIDLLNEMEVPVYLVISSRMNEMRKDVLEALYAFEPVLIVNDSDAWELCEQRTDKLEEAAALLHDGTKAPVILLMDEGKALYKDDRESFAAPGKIKADPDVWAAAYAAARLAGVDHKNAMVFANENGSQYEEETMKKRLAGMIMHR